MVTARIVGMLVGLVVGLSGWLLHWESYATLALFTMIYVVIMAIGFALTAGQVYFSAPFKDLTEALTRVHAERFFIGAWIMALAMLPLQCI